VGGENHSLEEEDPLFPLKGTHPMEGGGGKTISVLGNWGWPFSGGAFINFFKDLKGVPQAAVQRRSRDV